MSPYIICKVSNFECAIVQSEIIWCIYCTQIFRDSSLCYMLRIFSTDFLASGFLRDEANIIANEAKNVNKDMLIILGLRLC